MDEHDGLRIRRRGFLRFLTMSGLTAAVATIRPGAEAVADSETRDDKRKARYQANSRDVQTFYRVNRYPKK